MQMDGLMRLMTAALVVAMGGVAWAADGIWTENVDAAMKQAKAEQKDVLMEFTGSDWCPPCIQLKKNVFDTDHFKTEAPKHFVLVQLDFPHNKPQSEELKAQNRKWAEKFAVPGFPTIMLLDAEGQPYARTVGYPGLDAQQYVAQLQTMRESRVKRDKALAEAQQAQGIERAKLLDSALSALDSGILIPAYEAQVKEIVVLDADNAAGLKGRYEAIQLMPQIRQAMEGGSQDDAIAQIDTLFETYQLDGQLAQDLYLLKAEALFAKQDTDGTRAALQNALDAAPEGQHAQLIRQIIATHFAP